MAPGQQQPQACRGSCDSASQLAARWPRGWPRVPPAHIQQPHGPARAFAICRIGTRIHFRTAPGNPHRDRRPLRPVRKAPRPWCHLPLRPKASGPGLCCCCCCFGLYEHATRRCALPHAPINIFPTHAPIPHARPHDMIMTWPPLVICGKHSERKAGLAAWLLCCCWPQLRCTQIGVLLLRMAGS